MNARDWEMSIPYLEWALAWSLAYHPDLRRIPIDAGVPVDALFPNDLVFVVVRTLCFGGDHALTEPDDIARASRLAERLLAIGPISRESAEFYVRLAVQERVRMWLPDALRYAAEMLEQGYAAESSVNYLRKMFTLAGVKPGKGRAA